MNAINGSLNHLRLSVRDLAVSDAFYAAVLPHLGYTRESRDDGFAWAHTTASGDRQWLIFTAAEIDGRLPTRPPEAPGLHHLALNAVDRALVDKAHAALAAHGAEVLHPPREHDYEPGYYAAFFRDPDGFKIEIVHSPCSQRS
jgi:catechol 2,3-dioxygenase-like lactoylglutathione lyase family enzyme